MPDSDNRQHQRSHYQQLGVARLRRVTKKNEQLLVALVNLSYGGARLEILDSNPDTPHAYLAGDWVDFIVDGYAPINGRIVWTSNTVVALNFYQSAESVDQLLSTMNAQI